jgi:hypothetical protein
MLGMVQHRVANDYFVAHPAWLITVGADDPEVSVAVLEDEAQHWAEVSSFCDER